MATVTLPRLGRNMNMHSSSGWRDDEKPNLSLLDAGCSSMDMLVFPALCTIHCCNVIVWLTMN